MPRKPSATVTRISFTGASLGAVAKFLAGTDDFHFTSTMIDVDIFALFKPPLKDIILHLFFVQAT